MIHGGCVWETGNPADWLDFSANIRPEGPPEWVVEALRSSIDDVRYYPDINMRRARSGLSEYTGLPEECVLPTAGGEAAIDLALSYRNGRVYTLETDFGEYTRRAAVHGREVHRLPQVADFVNAAVGSRIDLKDVHGGTITNLAARLALAAGVRRRAVLAVQRPGQDLGRAGLACAPGAGKEIGMADAAGGNGTPQRAADMLLSHQILEGFRSPLAI